MDLAREPVTLDPEQVAQLNKSLSECRHNVNNCLSLILSAAELAQLKPDSAARMMKTIVDQANKVTDEIQTYSNYYERLLFDGAKKE